MNICHNRPETVQTADSQVKSQHNAERRGILCLPRYSEQRSQIESSGGDQSVREQTLPHPVSGRRLPIPRSLLVLSRTGRSSQAVRYWAQTSHR